MAADFAQQTGVSVALAKQQLLLVESKGAVCRDETIEGCRFFENLFCAPPEFVSEALSYLSTAEDSQI